MKLSRKQKIVGIVGSCLAVALIFFIVYSPLFLIGTPKHIEGELSRLNLFGSGNLVRKYDAFYGTCGFGFCPETNRIYTVSKRDFQSYQKEIRATIEHDGYQITKDTQAGSSESDTSIRNISASKGRNTLGIWFQPPASQFAPSDSPADRAIESQYRITVYMGYKTIF